jgi:hypothetical protein
MMTLRACICVFGAAGLLAANAAAQIGGKLVTGNPTPGTEQPAPPNLADRVTVTGCLQLASKSGGGIASTVVDGNTIVDSRFELTDARQQANVPPDTGGSPLTTTAPASRTYRLAAIESQLSPFVGAKVEVSGEILPRPERPPQSAPTLQVEFVQRIAKTCT